MSLIIDMLEALDAGHPISDALRVDAPKCAEVIAWYAEAADKQYGEVGPTGPGSLSLVTREPLGVVAAIVPWNYPLIIEPPRFEVSGTAATHYPARINPPAGTPVLGAHTGAGLVGMAYAARAAYPALP